MRFVVCVLAIVVFATDRTMPQASAAESGFGLYLLGSRGATALGVVPPPGTYFSSESFIYSGTYQTTTVDLAFDLLTPIWVTPVKVAGGRLGFATTLPVGYVGVGINSTTTEIWDDRIVLGDPSVTAFIGWDHEDVHWQVGAATYIPAQTYDAQRLANLSLNRPAVDTFASATWFPKGSGLDVSGSVGVTFNGENKATQYRTGTEFHVEGAVTKSVGHGFSLGALAYHYEQLTPDSGIGARLGPFKGRVSAIGAVLGYDFEIDKTPIYTRLQAVNEFDVRNRFKGPPIFLIVAVAWPDPK